MVFNFEVLALFISLIWLITLSFILWKLHVQFNNLSQGDSEKSLSSVLRDLLHDVNITKKGLDTLKIQYDKIDKEGSFHIQKIGLVRFNPFKDTGGDQSFILALLDNQESGVVVSALYSRAGTRWYAKKVERGKGIEHELSDEEKNAVRDAK